MDGQRFRQATAGGFGLSGPVPRDVVVLLAVVLATFSLRFFEATQPLHALLGLSSDSWRSGFLWQLGTYLFTGVGTPGIWFLIELLILFLFVRTVFYQLGRRGFWRWLILIGVTCGLVAVLVDVVASALVGSVPNAFLLMQGQHMLLVLTIAAFATMNRDATILLFFVLPVQAKWFLLLELLFAFMGFLSTHDLAGFVGLCSAVGLTFVYLGGGFGGGGWRQLWLRLQERWLRRRLKRMRRRRGLRLVDEEEPSRPDDWVH
ncbi:MAG: hypothetical protein R3244_07150 [Thermoanaerobaculia bacterium]|nr:hypothetical protein [Thermoanaerobaculia bacterium]